MLVQFSVENFRVFREKQTFSMNVDSRCKRQNLNQPIHSGFSIVPQIHRIASVYGANGAGKSSLIRAMLFVNRFVRDSFGKSPNDCIQTEPFLYHTGCNNAPSCFEINFIMDDTLFEYSMALSPERVEEERLIARLKSKGRARLMFSREFNHKASTYEWHINPSYLKGERNSWKVQTRSDALFLSTAVRLNCQPLTDMYSWLVKEPVFLFPSTSRNRQFTAKRLLQPHWKARILRYFRKLGIPLHDIEVRKTELFKSEIFAEYSIELQDSGLDDLPSRTEYQIYFKRTNNLKQVVELSIDEESSGTRALFDLAGPLLDSLDKGRTVIVDELNHDLHPLVVHSIVSMFGDQKQNPNNAQLIFTTQDVTIPDNDLIDRDQVWMVEKDREHASSLYSYSEFRTRFGTQFQKAYLEGRFGAIPTIL